MTRILKFYVSPDLQEVVPTKMDAGTILLALSLVLQDTQGMFSRYYFFRIYAMSFRPLKGLDNHEI